MHQNKNKNHIPVLLNEVLEIMDPKENESYLDLTAGFGGHFDAILSKTNNPHSSTLIDQDKEAFLYLSNKYKNKGVEIIHNDFLNASKQLLFQKKKYDLILADLGVSSLQLNTKERGFSFNLDGPLDMRMNKDQVLTADTVINKYPLKKLMQILKDYGEEPKNRSIAELIVKNRPIKNTLDLAQLVGRVWKGSKVNPATRTFQAIRIEVNNELEILENSIKIWLNLLNDHGRIGIITFHSLEDKIVKNFFKKNSSFNYLKIIKILTPKPIVPNPNEIVFNPRARSAKLRVAVKIKT